MNILEKIIKTLSLIVVICTLFFVGFVLFLSLVEFDNSEEVLIVREKSIGKNSSEMKMLFLGDMMLDRHVGEQIETKGVEYLFENLEEDQFFSGYDLIGVNLEGTVTNEGEHYDPIMSYDFAFEPDLINQLHSYNFNFFNLANNHFSDQGERGIIETRENLDNLDFDYVGCRDGQVADCSSEILEINGKKIGMAGFSTVYSLINEKAINQVVSDLASSTDLVIVNIHWGVEYEHEFNSIQQRLAHGLIDSGADIIIGHHPHVVQGMEIYKDKPIFYSLGNFIFDQYFSNDTQESLAIGLDITDSQQKFYLLPLKSELSSSRLMDTKEKETFINNFISWSILEDEFKDQIRNYSFLIN